MWLFRTETPQYRGAARRPDDRPGDRDSGRTPVATSERFAMCDWFMSLIRTPTPNYRPKPPQDGDASSPCDA